MSKIYRYIWMSGGGRGGDVHVPPYIFLFIIQKNEKSTRAPILKSNSTSFWFKNFFSRMYNKKNEKRRPLNFKERRRCNSVKICIVARVIPPHCVDNLLAFEEGGDSVPEIFTYFFFIIHFPTLTFSYFKSILLIEYLS